MTGKFLEEKGICKCYSAFPLDFCFWSHQTPFSHQSSDPKEGQSHRKLPGELPVAISISYCSPLTDTKQEELRGRESWLSLERLWETLWKVGFSLANGVTCHHVWSFLWLPSRGLLLELDRGAWEVSGLLTTWRSRSAISSTNKIQTKVTGLVLPSTSGRRSQKLQNNGVAHLWFPS